MPITFPVINQPTRNATETVGELTRNLLREVPALTLTRVDVGGVMQVRLNYPAFQCNLGGCCTSFPGGTITLNTADVAVPTNHYVVIPETTGVITVITSDPDGVYGRNAYVYLAQVRFQSIAGTEFVFYLRRMYNPIQNLLNEVGDYSSDIPYTWVSGAGMTIDPADGAIDLEATNYRRWKFASTLGAQTDAPILLEDETTAVANLEAITTYSDGSAITDDRYHKVALLLVCSGAADERIVALRQGPPTAEYTTLEEARIDAENRAATVAPLAYYAPTFPLAYVYMKKGDASDLGVIDLREPGFGGGGGGGGGAGVGDHSLLVNLGADDHLQYSRTDGTRAFTGDIDLGGNEVTNVGDVDGVDVSAHAADDDAHHDAFTEADHTAIGNAAPHHVRYADAEADARIAAARAYGNIYVTAGAAGQVMVANTPALLTAYDTNGVSSNTTPDQANNRITVTNAGNYRIAGAFTFESSATNTNYRFFAAVGGVASVIGGATRATAANQPFHASFNGLLALGAGNVVTVLATSSGNTTLTVTESHLTVERVG